MILSLRQILTLSLLFAITMISMDAFAENKTFRTTSDAGFLYELKIEADALEVMKPLPVTIKVSDSDNSSIAGAKLNCDLSMPAMAMPLNTPTIKESSTAGLYEGIFLLTMGGLWQVEISSMYASGEKESVLIPFYLSNPENTGSGVDSKLEELFHEKK